MLCPFCKEEIAEDAIKCKHCKSMLAPEQNIPPAAAAVAVAVQAASASAPIWASITSLVLGILAAMTGLTTDWFDQETAVGMLMAGVLAIIFGGIALSKKYRGKGMAIAGMVTGIIGVLCFLGIEWQ